MLTIKKIIEAVKSDQKLLIMFLLGITGISLILISEFCDKGKSKQVKEIQTNTFVEYASDTEKKLETIISQINGVGRVRVMITLKSGEENKYAYNEKYQIKNDDASKDSKTENEYVLIDTEKGEECVLLKTEYPQVQGVIIVCEGGDSNYVKNEITNAVSGLLNISTNNISVLKMKSTEE